MTKVKSRGADAPISTAPKVHVQRLANLGKSVTLFRDVEDSVESFDVVVKDFTLEKLLSILPKLEPLIDLFSVKDNTAIVKTIANPAVLSLLKSVAAAMTRKTESDFDGVHLKSWIELVSAAQEVVDWDRLKELFSNLGLEMNLVSQAQLEQ